MAKKETKKPAKAKELSPEEKAIKEAEALAKKALADANKLKAKKEKAAANAKLEKDKKVKTDAALRKLDIVAKEINSRAEKAEALDGKADDHRLAIAIQLADAEKRCKADKINFKVWVEGNVNQGWESSRKLVAIGRSDNPALALEDMRNKNKSANKKSRDAKKSGTNSTPAGSQKQAATPFIAAEQTMLALEDKTREAVISSVAAKDGFVVMPKAEAEKQRKHAEAYEAPKATGVNTYEDAVAIFDSLKASEKMKLVKYGADFCGMELVNPLEEE